MKTDTRQRLIDAAVKRFYQDGFHGAAMDQILAEVGISKTAFYKHFESKDELLLASLEDRNQWLQGQFRQLVRERGGDSPLSQLRAVFDVVGTILEQEGFQGCLFVKIVMEFPLPHEPAHCAAAANKRAIQDFVTELARQAQARDPAALAEELCMIMEGAYTTRQVAGYEPTMVIARRLAEQTIARHVDPESVAATKQVVRS
jgi:AcrR family transcriptional regulator